MKNGLEMGEKNNIMRGKRKESLCLSYAILDWISWLSFIHIFDKWVH